MKDVNLNVTEEGTLEDFLGVNVDRQADGTMHLIQPQLIESILKDLRLLQPGVNMKTTPSCSSRILQRHKNAKPFDNSFNYRSVIGKLNYPERGSRSDISYTVHQCARLTSCPKVEHGEAIK